jgi:hypothetical protein
MLSYGLVAFPLAGEYFRSQGVAYFIPFYAGTLEGDRHLFIFDFPFLESIKIVNNSTFLDR